MPDASRSQPPQPGPDAEMLFCERRALSQKRVVFGMGEIVPKTEVFGTRELYRTIQQA